MQINAQNISGGVFISTMIPFAQDDSILLDPISDHADFVSSITGVLGIAINTTARERCCINLGERLEVIRRTRAGLAEDQFLITCIGKLSETMINEVRQSQAAGANAIIACPAKSPLDDDTNSVRRLAALFDAMPLPIIVALGHGQDRWPTTQEEIKAIAAGSGKILGFDMGNGDNVLQYDQDYYAIKSLDRPIACLSSSDSALFHNLNTGGDGVLSCLGSIAPYEVSTLYQASRAGCFSEAQAIHNQLAPLVALLNIHDGDTHELLYREAAYHRGFLASPHARGITKPLSSDLRDQLHKTIADIGIKCAC